MRRAQTGIGTLLIFLATIVVAVLAASVFITTASNLQQKAFAVGGEAKERVSATIDVESVTGYKADATAPVTYDGKQVERYVENLTMVVKLAPGAEPIKLDDDATTIQILTPHWQVLAIKYNGTVTGSGVWPNNVQNTERFYVWEEQSVNRDGIWEVFSPGEVYTLVIALDTSATPTPHIIPEEEPVVIKFLSRTGMSTAIRFKAPNVIKDPIVQLYP